MISRRRTVTAGEASGRRLGKEAEGRVSVLGLFFGFAKEMRWSGSLDGAVEDVEKETREEEEGQRDLEVRLS
jgi:hypothetical protein